MKNNKQIPLLAICASIMLIIGYIFEVLLKWPFLGTYVTPSPAEGILIFIVMLFGVKKALTTFAVYCTILFIFKGLSPTLVNEFALISSALLTITVFDLTYNKKNIKFLNAAVITVLVNTAIMTLLNAYFISPTFVKNTWTTYRGAFPCLSFWQVLKWVIMPPAGILHGNFIKYTLCFVLAALASKTFIKIK